MSIIALCLISLNYAKEKTAAKNEKPYKAPEFLVDLLEARSPTGHEYEAQAVVDAHIESVVDGYRKDTMGNRFATVNPEGDPQFSLPGTSTSWD